MTQRGHSDELRVFEPDDPREAVQGWALHATRRRKIHEAEARHLDRVRYWLGSISTLFAAIAGASALAAWQSTTESVTLAVLTAAIGIAATFFGGLVTFLDPGGRSEAHRRAATSYKSILRKFEEAAGSKAYHERAIDEKVFQELKSMLADADTGAPTVPEGRGRDVEHEPFRFVGRALDLFPNERDKQAAEPEASRPAASTPESSE